MQDLWERAARKSDPGVSRPSESDSNVSGRFRPLAPPPQTRAEDAKLADHVAAHNTAVAPQNSISGFWRGLDELHKDIAGVGGLGNGFEEGRDGGAVDVVAAAFTLRF